MALELYHSHISTCSQKVRIALAEKGIDWVSRPVDLSKHENLTPAFLAINPNGVVPAFVHDGRPIYESTVMYEYLDERWPDAPRLAPDDLVADHISIADICITPVIVRMEDIDMAGMWEGKYPRVATWYARAQACPSFAAVYYPGARISWQRPGYAAKAS